MCSIWQGYFIPALWPFMCITTSLRLSLELAVLTFALQNGVHRRKPNISLGTMEMPVELSKFQIGFDLWIGQLVYSSKFFIIQTVSKTSLNYMKIICSHFNIDMHALNFSLFENCVQRRRRQLDKAGLRSEDKWCKELNGKVRNSYLFAMEQWHTSVCIHEEKGGTSQR